MARINDLVKRVADARLRAELQDALDEILSRKQFGLVFEEHLPEISALPGMPIRVGSLVLRREADKTSALYRVTSTGRSGATIVPTDGGAPIVADPKSLIAAKPFGEPIFPGLSSVGREVRGGPDRPHSAVVNAENYHALQLFLFMYDGQVDCIYIDPPYNTGAQHWKYNNRIVDPNDAWRHSKWLSMMERRLRLSRRLLKPDGVLVVTIDENEHAHLVMLLESVFKGWQITSVAIVHNPRGVQGDNFSYTNEFAVFVIPPMAKVIAPRQLSEVERDANASNLRNWGGESFRTDAKNCFYPVLVKNKFIIGFGDVPLEKFHPKAANVQRGGGITEVWPIDEGGVERKWRYARQSVEAIRQLLQVADARNGDLNVLIRKTEGPFKTVWQDKRFDASVHGTQLLNDFVGRPFTFPKSLYAVYEVLYSVTRNRPGALILDFFAGSGTTLHATWLLNTTDNGSRRCVLVTNNEVGEEEAKVLANRGHKPGDKAYEAEGIFEQVTCPRVRAALTGMRPDRRAVPGVYKAGDERAHSAGFKENVEFFRLDYLDPELVDLGRQFEAILPILWLTAGGLGPRVSPKRGALSLIPERAPYAVLLKDSSFPRFATTVIGRPDLTHVWLVTNSPEAFAEMRAMLPRTIRSSMLYRDYLRTFRINTGEAK